MLFLQITSAVTAIVLVILAICLIPVLVELKKAAVALQGVADLLQKEAAPLVTELRDTVAHVQVITNVAAANAEGVSLLLSELGHAGQNIRMINKVLGIASNLVSSAPVWMTGAKVAGKYIADRIIKSKIRG